MENLKKLLTSLEGKSFDDLKNNCEFTIKEKGNLYMLSFNDKNDLNDKMVREVNGIILEKDTNKLVHYSFSKAYDGLTKEDGDDYYSKTLDKFKVQILYEGTLIKLFHYNNEWHIATSRSIDAVYSYWGSENSFKELFLETCDEPNVSLQFDLLDKTCCYSYLLQHPEIVLGYDVTIPHIIPINKFDPVTLEETSYMHYYSSEMTIKDVISKLSYGTNFMIITDDNERIKLLSKEYKNVKNLLDNKTLKWAYIESLKNYADDFRSFFPSKWELFDDIDNKFTDVVEEIHNLYFAKFIKREEDVEVNHKYSKTLYQLHARYKKTRERTTKDIVYYHLLDLKTKSLYWVLDI